MSPALCWRVAGTKPVEVAIVSRGSAQAGRCRSYASRGRRPALKNIHVATQRGPSRTLEHGTHAIRPHRMMCAWSLHTVSRACRGFGIPLTVFYHPAGNEGL